MHRSSRLFASVFVVTVALCAGGAAFAASQTSPSKPVRLCVDLDHAIVAPVSGDRCGAGQTGVDVANVSDLLALGRRVAALENQVAGLRAQTTPVVSGSPAPKTIAMVSGDTIVETIIAQRTFAVQRAGFYDVRVSARFAANRLARCSAGSTEEFGVDSLYGLRFEIGGFDGGGDQVSRVAETETGTGTSIATTWLQPGMHTLRIVTIGAGNCGSAPYDAGSATISDIHFSVQAA